MDIDSETVTDIDINTGIQIDFEGDIDVKIGMDIINDIDIDPTEYDLYALTLKLALTLSQN